MDWQQILTKPELLQTGLLIDGNFIIDRQTFTVNNTATDEIIANVAIATGNDLEHAINSAEIAMARWKKLAVKVRSEILAIWYQLVIDNADDLAKILTLEQGKPLAEAKNEILYSASYIKWYAEEARRVYGQIIPANNSDQRISVIYEPIGICAAITPWNFPSAMLGRKVAPALASGCALIAKPARQTPLSANALAYLALKAGIPNGLFNIVHGDSEEIGNFFCNHPLIRKLTFTGSTGVGIKLYQKSAVTMKKLSLELGGNAPLIVFADANLDTAVNGIMQSKFRNAGQTCVCANRVFIHNSIKDQLIVLLVQKVTAIKLGNGLKENIDMGPLIDDKAVKHANELISEAIAHGSKLICGGEIESGLGRLFYKPTIIDCKNINLNLFNQEIFAPILAIYGFETDGEVITMANSTPYGLASYFFSQDITKIYKIAEELDYGIVGINTGIISAENVPFGGVKMSGLGREGGSLGIEEYLSTKYICLNLG